MAVIAPLCEATLCLLRQEAVCQQTGDTDSEGDEDDMEHDELLIDAVTDILPALGACMGPAFEPSFRPFFEPLMKFAVRSTHFPFCICLGLLEAMNFLLLVLQFMQLPWLLKHF